MKKILFLLSIASCVSFHCFSQTKKIAHRSHSGKDKDLQYDSEDNFGLPPAEYRKKKEEKAKADSLQKAKGDSAKNSAPHNPAIKKNKRAEATLPKKQKVNKAGEKTR